MHILALNAGSSSIKYQIFDMCNNELQQQGIAEHIREAATTCYRWQDAEGEQQAELPGNDHRAIFEHIFRTLKLVCPLNAITHRVVHGGTDFTQPTCVDEPMLAQLQQLSPLAPLHNPACIAGIETAMTQYPTLPHVAIFDTAFHQSMPEYAYRYGVSERLYRDFGVRRFGFHGIAHAHLAQQAAEFLEQPLADLNLITLHLGNGASVTAIEQGRCVDTSMGMTPQAGLVMGSRCGDLDTGAIIALIEQGLSPAEINKELNQESGLKGLCGNSDMRDIEQRVAIGDKSAELALQIFCYRIRHYLGAYYARLGRVDALLFSGGIGEHSSLIRQRVCEGLGLFGLDLCPTRNQAAEQKIRRIDTQSTDTAILVIPANEGWEMARQAYHLLTD